MAEPEIAALIDAAAALAPVLGVWLTVKAVYWLVRAAEVLDGLVRDWQADREAQGAVRGILRAEAKR